jgi:hypothetical protein
MTATRTEHTATPFANGKVLIAGGFGGGGGILADDILASAELYDPAAGTFSPTGSMAAARINHTATPLHNSKVLVAGGFNFGGVLASAELYNPATGTFSATGSMTAARTQHTATPLDNGEVLVAGGGFGGGIQLDSAELYRQHGRRP